VALRDEDLREHGEKGPHTKGLSELARVERRSLVRVGASFFSYFG
jgi:hypothetical protein